MTILYCFDGVAITAQCTATFLRLRWAGHVARMEKDRSAFKILNLQERDLLEGLLVDERIILE